jgi:3-phosphoshikimate 1-carboxyvinyltransferase
MATLVVTPQRHPLRGAIRVPGDKSISHRALLLAAIAGGTSRIERWLPAGDTLATLAAVRALGMPLAVTEDEPNAWTLVIEGQGLHGLQPPAAPLDCRNAGTCMRLLAGILAGQPFASVLDGSEQLRRRPMRRIIAPLAEMGATIESAAGRAPLAIEPAPLRGIDYRLPVASAQVKSAVLLAGLYAEGQTRVYQPGPARDHTERMLQAMGVPVTTDGPWVTLPVGPHRLQPLQMAVPGDISSAAFLLVAASIVPGSEIRIASVGANPTRTGMLDLLQAMGASVSLEAVRASGGEPVADLTVQFDELQATTASGDVVVRAIDEFPVWAVAASQADGTSLLHDAAELRVKEVDRIGVLAGQLQRLGIPIAEAPDGFAVEGPVRIQGGAASSHGDHRLGMALAVAGLAATGPVRVEEADCIADSFPGFVETMQFLGASMTWES